MPRPRRTDEEKLEDLFFDLPIERQRFMLDRQLPTLHRLKKRTGDDQAPAQQPLLAAEGGSDAGEQ